MKAIIFSTEMVQAILEGMKSQTRRVMKPQPTITADRWYWKHRGTCYALPNQGAFHDGLLGIWQATPYQVGDRLWVRETLYRNPYFDEAGYMADNSPVMIDKTIGDMLKWQWKKDTLPSIFMPRWASRITLDVLKVRAERLQDITEEDAKAEGSPCGYVLASPTIFDKGHPSYTESPKDYKLGFQRLWDCLNGKKHPWENNDWVWVYDFRRVEG